MSSCTCRHWVVILLCLWTRPLLLPATTNSLLQSSGTKPLACLTAGSNGKNRYGKTFLLYQEAQSCSRALREYPK